MLYKCRFLAAGKIADISTRFMRWLRDVTRPKHSKHLCVVADLFRTKTELVAENVSLRQQIVVLNRHVIFFQTIFAFFIVELGSRRIMHFAVTRSPSRQWVALYEYRNYFDNARPHQGIGQRVPCGTTGDADAGNRIVSIPILGGLHHEYRRVA